ncbi:MAG: helix-turn-helix domain-containing protein [bacterium]|nr:helix-turn-helix domain-containing protein [bacterium]
MLDQVAEIRAAIAAQAARGPREPYMAQVQELVGTYGQEKRCEGWSWRRIAAAVGMSPTTVSRYTHRHGQNEDASMVPVVMSRAEPSLRERPLVLVSPSGFRLEGLMLDEAVRLLDVLR